jgi:hypothetical protein
MCKRCKEKTFIVYNMDVCEGSTGMLLHNVTFKGVKKTVAMNYCSPPKKLLNAKKNKRTL